MEMVLLLLYFLGFLGSLKSNFWDFWPQKNSSVCAFLAPKDGVGLGFVVFSWLENGTFCNAACHDCHGRYGWGPNKMGSGLGWVGVAAM